jgi:hypothetical protein
MGNEMTDIVQEEISRIYSKEVKSSFEKDLEQEIIIWANKRDMHNLSLKAMANMFWKEKLQ